MTWRMKPDNGEEWGFGKLWSPVDAQENFFQNVSENNKITEVMCGTLLVALLCYLTLIAKADFKIALIKDRI